MISSREAECVLARTELPGDGIRFDVTITHIERPDCIFIQRVPPTEVDQGISDDPDPTLDSATEELRTLEEIMAKINSADYFKKYTPLTTASEGELSLPFMVEFRVLMALTIYNSIFRNCFRLIERLEKFTKGKSPHSVPIGKGKLSGRIFRKNIVPFDLQPKFPDFVANGKHP